MVAVAIAFALTRVAILAWYQPAGTDVTVYHEYFTRAANGGVPYRDFAIEYPPVAWWIMTAPSTQDWPAYLQQFRRLMFFCDAAAFGLFVTIVRRRQPPFTSPASFAYVFATAALAPVLYDRLDAGLLLFLMLWAYAAIRARDSSPAHAGWAAWSYFFLGVGTAYKLMPIVVAGIILASEVTERGGLTRAAKGLAAFAVGALPPFLMHVPTAGLATFSFLGHHAGRGIEIGSIYSNVSWVMSLVGLPIRIEYRFTAFEVVSPLSPALATLATLLTVLVLIALAVIGLQSVQSGARRIPLLLGLVVLPAIVPLSPVLSPQYLVWLIPLILLAATELVTSRRAFAALCALVILLAVLTTLVYPIGFGGLREFRPDVWAILTVRNVLLVGLGGWLIARVRSLKAPS